MNIFRISGSAATAVSAILNFSLLGKFCNLASKVTIDLGDNIETSSKVDTVLCVVTPISGQVTGSQY